MSTTVPYWSNIRGGNFAAQQAGLGCVHDAAILPAERSAGSSRAAQRAETTEAASAARATTTMTVANVATSYGSTP